MNLRLQQKVEKICKLYEQNYHHLTSEDPANIRLADDALQKILARLIEIKSMPDLGEEFNHTIQISILSIGKLVSGKSHPSEALNRFIVDNLHDIINQCFVRKRDRHSWGGEKERIDNYERVDERELFQVSRKVLLSIKGVKIKQIHIYIP